MYASPLATNIDLVSGEPVIFRIRELMQVLFDFLLLFASGSRLPAFGAAAGIGDLDFS